MTYQKLETKKSEPFILGKCQCGCNEDIPVRNSGGDLQRYKNHHHRSGKKNSPEIIKKMKKAHNTKEFIDRISQANLGENNGMWKGNEVGYRALHDYIKYHLPKPDRCEECDEWPPYDLANISGKYLRELVDWQWLCRKCHMILDGRMKSNLKQFQK